MAFQGINEEGFGKVRRIVSGASVQFPGILGWVHLKLIRMPCCVTDSPNSRRSYSNSNPMRAASFSIPKMDWTYWYSTELVRQATVFIGTEHDGLRHAVGLFHKTVPGSRLWYLHSDYSIDRLKKNWVGENKSSSVSPRLRTYSCTHITSLIYDNVSRKKSLCTKLCAEAFR